MRKNLSTHSFQKTWSTLPRASALTKYNISMPINQHLMLVVPPFYLPLELPRSCTRVLPFTVAQMDQQHQALRKSCDYCVR